MSTRIAIVLGAAVWPGGIPSPTLRRRAERAAALYLAGEVDGIIGSGGLGDHPPAEAAAIRDIVTALGVPDAAVQQEDRSRTTLENLTFSRELMPADAVAVIVTDAWHLPRARLVARRLGLHATGARPPLRGAHPGRVARATLREIFAFTWYLLRPMRR